MPAQISHRRGLTLVETTVSVAIMAFIFSAIAFLVFYAGRNSYIVREQVRSQTNASAAIERIANTLRNAQGFGFHGTDDSSTTPLLKMVYGIPSPADLDKVTTGIIAFKKPSKPGAADGIIQIYEDVSNYGVDKTPDWEYGNIEKFSITMQSAYWANFRVSYIYRGFLIDDTDANNDGIKDAYMAGEFVTDVIAKNHHTGDTNADYTTSTLTSL